MHLHKQINLSHILASKCISRNSLEVLSNLSQSVSHGSDNVTTFLVAIFRCTRDTSPVTLFVFALADFSASQSPFPILLHRGRQDFTTNRSSTRHNNARFDRVIRFRLLSSYILSNENVYKMESK